MKTPKTAKAKGIKPDISGIQKPLLVTLIDCSFSVIMK